MSFVTGDQMRKIEGAAFQRGISAEALMDEAGAGIGRRLMAHFPQPGAAVAYLGKGNNGGDALVALKVLRQAGWAISIRTAIPENQWTSLAQRKLAELGPDLSRELPVLPVDGTLLLLDGLLGIGAKGAPRGPLAPLAAEMESLRRDWGAVVAAIDLPSGLDSDTGTEDAVTADLTVTVSVPKKGLVTEAGTGCSGRILVVPVKDLPPPDDAGPTLFCPDFFPGLLPPRPHDFHKGDAGRLGILAGSPGMTGAAVMSATAALTMGAGLIVLHLDQRTADSIVAPLPPEIMLKISDDPVKAAFEMRHDALVIGPGWGDDEERLEALVKRLECSNRPCLLDADALNGIAAKHHQGVLKEHHLITPHPGEFKRLASDLAELPRQEAAAQFVARHPCTLLLKGARTVVAAPGQPLRINPTGHGGMASGGQGDTLSGVAGALLAGGVKGIDAASLAAWLCGRAAERGLTNGPYTTASDTLRHLGAAVLDWQRRLR